MSAATDLAIAWRDVVRHVKGQPPSKFLGLRRVSELRLRNGQRFGGWMRAYVLALTFLPQMVAVGIQVFAHQRRMSAFRRETMRIARRN